MAVPTKSNGAAPRSCWSDHRFQQKKLRVAAKSTHGSSKKYFSPPPLSVACSTAHCWLKLSAKLVASPDSAGTSKRRHAIAAQKQLVPAPRGAGCSSRLCPLKQNEDVVPARGGGHARSRDSDSVAMAGGRIGRRGGAGVTDSLTECWALGYCAGSAGARYGAEPIMGINGARE